MKKYIRNRFWTMLERSPMRIGSMADWQRGTGPEHELFAPMLHPVEGLARSITDPDDIDGLFPLSVVDYGNGKYGAIDEGLTRRIPLTLEDIIIYTLDFNDFRHLLAQVLGIEAGADMMPSTNVAPMRFGMCQIKPGVEFPVYMILARDEYLMLNQVRALLTTERKPFFILTATRSNWTQEIQQLLHDWKSQIVSLEECVMVEDGHFVKSETWDNAVDAFRSMHFPENLVPAPPFEFRKKGDMWVIRFAGEDMYLKDSVGLRCIGQLLAKPNDPVFVSDLKMIIDGQNPQNLPAPTASGEVVDREYLKDIARKYLELEAEYEAAKETGELALAKEIQEEMAKLMAIIKEAKGFGGRIKEANEKLNSIRISIYQAISRTLESIKIELPNCFSHLEPRIATGFILNYLPDKMVSWVI